MAEYDQALIKMQQGALDKQEDEIHRLNARNVELATEVINERGSNALYRAENRALTRRLGEVYQENMNTEVAP